MAMLDGLLSQISQHVDVADLAQKVGIPQDAAAAAIGALAQAHTDPGDTVEVAQGTTGLSPDILNQIIGHIGGEGSLANYATILTQSGVLGSLAGGLGGLLGQQGEGEQGAAAQAQEQGGIGNILGQLGGLLGNKQ
ncbi:hypothetical protein LZK98_11115 [Sphingomonas cannabina]|uniref:hypothetical protein n=1 Tax=Sphingomonas cannabina TaxID=2899123 RepID=UPI001F1B63F8|nr:hypothetical protein [Sphingomonas cannabina]UIJ43640.1 hypothetical protein LZK98_11115 [Sphingomonas cannabina]